MVRRRVHDQSVAGRPDGRARVGGLRVRGGAARARARRAGAVAGAASVLLEEREVGARPDADAAGRAWLLGGSRLSQPRRPVARAALLERLTVERPPIVWRLATVREVVEETAHARTI